MKKVLSLFAVFAMVAFAGCAKKRDEENPNYTKKENMRSDRRDRVVRDRRAYDDTDRRDYDNRDRRDCGRCHKPKKEKVYKEKSCGRCHTVRRDMNK